MKIFKHLTWTFTFLGVIFLISGILMGYNVRKFYPEFYKQYGCYIWVVTALLTLPLFYRAIDE